MEGSGIQQGLPASIEVVQVEGLSALPEVSPLVTSDANIVKRKKNLKKRKRLQDNYNEDIDQSIARFKVAEFEAVQPFVDHETAAPPWFQAAVTVALAPIRAELAEVKAALIELRNYNIRAENVKYGHLNPLYNGAGNLPINFPNTRRHLNMLNTAEVNAFLAFYNLPIVESGVDKAAGILRLSRHLAYKIPI